MNVGDTIVVWFRDDPRTITGVIEKLTDAIVYIRCTGEDGSSTLWNVWAKDILTLGINTPAPS